MGLKFVACLGGAIVVMGVCRGGVDCVKLVDERSTTAEIFLRKPNIEKVWQEQVVSSTKSQMPKHAAGNQGSSNANDKVQITRPTGLVMEAPQHPISTVLPEQEEAQATHPTLVARFYRKSLKEADEKFADVRFLIGQAESLTDELYIALSHPKAALVNSQFEIWFGDKVVYKTEKDDFELTRPGRLLIYKIKLKEKVATSGRAWKKENGEDSEVPKLGIKNFTCYMK